MSRWIHKQTKIDCWSSTTWTFEDDSLNISRDFFCSTHSSFLWIFSYLESQMPRLRESISPFPLCVWTFLKEWNRTLVRLASFVSSVSGMNGLYWLMSRSFETFDSHILSVVFFVVAAVVTWGEDKSCP